MATDFNTQLAALIEAYTGLKVPADQLLTGQFTYLSGTLDDPDSFDADGKPATDPTHGPLGYYPLLNGSGATAYVPCLRRVAALASGAAPAFAAEAEASADAAAASATAAAASATSASGSAATATAGATTATTKAGEASASALDAAGSASSAAGSASAASTAAGTATTKAGEASASATAAAGSASSAASSATAAAASAAIADRAAGGSNGQVQVNGSGVLTGSASLIWTSGRLGVGDTGGAPGAEIHVRKATGDVNVSIQSDASGTSYINLIGPLVAYGGLRASNGTGEEWRIGGLGSSGTFGISLGGTTRFNINSQSVTVGAASAAGIAFRVGGIMESTDRAQATAFVPTGSSIPTNGLYLSAANVLGLSINSAQAFLLSGLSASFTGAGYNFQIIATGTNNVGTLWRRNGADVGYIGNGPYAISGAGASDFGINAQSGDLVLGVGFAEKARLNSSGTLALGSVQATGTLRPGSFTVATLPSASAVGDGAIARVSDANSTTFRAVVAGGGSNKINVVADSGTWKIGA
ncbi:hypothetical protein [Rhizorhabdus sp.]|uniref:hypothetical protein n=1 Tax=Rhizorhabdus sp. TaxID=1968843 RepID=UPI0035AEF19B